MSNAMDILENDIQTMYDHLVSKVDFSKDNYLGYERFIVFDHAIRLDRLIRGLPFPPIQVDLQMSSFCNLNCRWCVGNVTAEVNEMQHLPNTLTEEKVRNIIQEIINFSDDELAVETVQFSGFTGEPLVKRNLTMLAMQLLRDSGIRVGIFTNGVLMEQETWDTLLSIQSVFVSLDGGMKSWKDIKRPKVTRKYDLYEMVLKNLDGICKLKKENGSSTEIHVGYTITMDNYEELDNVVESIKHMGLNSICIRHDITGSDFDGGEKVWMGMLDSIEECRRKHDDPNGCRVFVMHESKQNDTTSTWKCSYGCYYRYFFCTIGSNGKMYPCDYQTISGCPDFGEIGGGSFQEAWESKQHEWDLIVTNHVDFKNICPPFAEKINPFIGDLYKLRDKYGSEAVVSVLNRIRENYK